MTSATTEMREFIDQHRAHYEVVPEMAVTRGGRQPVGFEVKLLAVHEKGSKALPGCSKCGELLAGLRALAEAVLPAANGPALVTIEPFDPVLYDSRRVPGADEIALVIRVCHREGYDRPIDASEQSCVREIRERFKALGVPEH